MKRTIYLLILILLVACGDSKKSNNQTSTKKSFNIPNDLKWEIRKETSNNTFKKGNIEINLSKKVTKEILKNIALKIRNNRQKYDKLWIFYYIPNMTSGMAWATTHFTPKLDIHILGSIDLQDKVTSNTSDIVGEVVGKWRSEKSLLGATLILYKDNNKLQMRTVFKNGQKMDSEIIQSKINGKTRFDDNNGHGEYYLMESNGNLGMYSKNGKFDEAINIKE